MTYLVLGPVPLNPRPRVLNRSYTPSLSAMYSRENIFKDEIFFVCTAFLSQSLPVFRP